MFQKLITLLNDGKRYSLLELSEELGISIETLQGFIEYLSEKGLLTPLEFHKDINSHSNGCNNCTSCKGCFVGVLGRCDDLYIVRGVTYRCQSTR
ncbi:MAG TPA: hypothetical protein GXX67_03875 [Petrimonas sp.]|nr:hypothetical protein [Petrimonas sp.]